MYTNLEFISARRVASSDNLEFRIKNFEFLEFRIYFSEKGRNLLVASSDHHKRESIFTQGKSLTAKYVWQNLYHISAPENSNV